MSERPAKPHGGGRPVTHKNDRSTLGKGTPNISPARTAAFEILLRIAESDAHSDDLLHSSVLAGLTQEDRNLTTALVMGVLRWQIALDGQIAKLLARPGQRLAEPVAIALRMGAFQLLHMDRIPAHAAINESVELCRAAEQPHAAGMVNAILRGIGREMESAKPRDAAAVKRSIPIFESPAAFAQRLGHPAWLVERWVASYGREAALAICEYGQHEPKPGGLFPDTDWSDEEGASLPAARLQMDDGSRLVAELAAAAIGSRGDRAARVWDCCAAPGGKTLVLAERLLAAQILATDISPRRLEPMRGRVAASPHAARILCEVRDASRPGAQASDADRDGVGSFDLILCDAPCSGTGTLARNPEIRHRLRPEELGRQAARQLAILNGALTRLAPGGRLLYSTCSLEPEENEQVVAAVLADGPGMQLVPLGPILEGLAGSGILDAKTADLLASTALRDGCLRTTPGLLPCDGFFAALLERAN